MQRKLPIGCGARGSAYFTLSLLIFDKNSAGPSFCISSALEEKCRTSCGKEGIAECERLGTHKVAGSAIVPLGTLLVATIILVLFGRSSGPYVRGTDSAGGRVLGNGGGPHGWQTVATVAQSLR